MSDAEKQQVSFLLSNTVLFAQKVCRVLCDMVQVEVTPSLNTLKAGPIPAPRGVIAFAAFFGKVTGQFSILMDQETARGLSSPVALLRESGAADVGKPCSDFLKEVLNIAVGHSLLELEKTLGALTHLAPTIVYGEADFPDVMTAHVESRSTVGTIMCACSLNMANLRIAQELEKAQGKLLRVHESQSAMLIQPADKPAARFSVCYQSLHEAGGDFYDIIEISDNSYGYFVADVAGHDIGVGFLTASVRALLKQNCTPHFTPGESLRNINNVLCDLLSSFEYVTACYAVLDRKTGNLSVATMGHPPLLFVPREGEPLLVRTDGNVLGVFRNSTYTMVDQPVGAGDRFIMLTDGLVEGVLGSVWTEGVQQLPKFSDVIRRSSVVDMADALFKKIFQGRALPQDDIVVLGIEV